MRASGLAAMLLLLLLLLGGCAERADPPDDAPPPPAPPLAVEDTVFGDLVGTQDRARAGADAAREQERARIESGIEAAEGSAPEE